MKGEVKVGPFLLSFFTSILSLGIMLLPVYVVVEKTEKVDEKGMLFLLLLFWMGFLMLYMLLSTAQTVRVDKGKIVIGVAFGLKKYHYAVPDLESFSLKVFRSRYGKAQRGFLLDFRDGNQFHLHGRWFSNIDEVRDAIRSIIGEDIVKKPQHKIAGAFLKTMLWIGGALTFGIILMRFV